MEKTHQDLPFWFEEWTRYGESTLVLKLVQLINVMVILIAVVSKFM